MTIAPLAGGVASILPHSPARGRLRIAFNRDESRQRGVARPPEFRACGIRRAVMPIDPDSGGTWIAANDAGLVTALLNIYGDEPSDRSREKQKRSRGEIVPQLMACSTFDEMVAWLTPAARFADYAAFRLVLTDGHRLVEIQAQNRSVIQNPIVHVAKPLMFTSSGLGDALVDPPRRRLFDSLFTPGSDKWAAQDTFHRHQWPDRPEVSVRMSRNDARTVSLTVIDWSDDQVEMTYFPAAADGAIDNADVSQRIGRRA